MTTMDATLFYSLIIIALIVTIVFISPLRLVFLTLPLYGLLKGRMPSISTTEREAIDAGTVWWEASLLRGKPNWRQLHQLGQPRLSRKEQNFIDKQTEQLCALCDDWAVQKQADLSKDVWTFIKKHRFFGMIIPEAYGGLGFSAAGHAAVITKLASRSPVLAVTVMVPNSLGPAELIMKYGTEQQKAHYLPRLARGDEIPCFALTSLKAGSDASAIEDKAVVCRGTYNGKACLGLRTTWEKRYITLAPVATVIGLAVKVYDPQGLLEPSLFNGKKELGITCLLVPAHLSGVRKGLRHSPLDVFFQNGPTSGTDVFLPFECIIGGKEAIGKGWQMLIECLAVGRSLSLPSLSNAVHQTSVYTSSLYTSLRYQFHRPIGTFEAVAHKLACMVLSSHVVRASSRLALAAIDAGNQPAVVSAMLKYTSTERARCTLNHAMDIHGGKAIMQGPNNYLAHSYKSLPIMITVEGANTLTRALIVFGQGALRCHPYLYRELQCLTQDHRGGLFTFNRLLGGHMRYHVWLFFKTWFARWSGGWLLPIPKNARPPIPKNAHLYQTIHQQSLAFAYISDILLLFLGGTFKRKEMLSARLADCWASLFQASAVLTQAQTQARGQTTPDMTLITRAACQQCLAASEDALQQLCRNAPTMLLRFYLHLLLFPFGKQHAPPKDHVYQRIAKRVRTQKDLRETLCPDLYRATFKDLDKAASLEPTPSSSRHVDKVLAVDAFEKL